MKTKMTYAQFEVYVDNLVDRIKSSTVMKDLRFVYGLPRGGWPIAVHLSHHLELKLADSYPHLSQVNHILVVDDIADTGNTLAKFATFCRATATIYCNLNKSVIKPTFYVAETNNWIIFPWEKQ